MINLKVDFEHMIPQMIKELDSMFLKIVGVPTKVEQFKELVEKMLAMIHTDDCIVNPYFRQMTYYAWRIINIFTMTNTPDPNYIYEMIHKIEAEIKSSFVGDSWKVR